MWQLTSQYPQCNSYCGQWNLNVLKENKGQPRILIVVKIDVKNWDKAKTLSNKQNQKKILQILKGKSKRYTLGGSEVIPMETLDIVRSNES
jgi:hypothetical protein